MIKMFYKNPNRYPYFLRMQPAFSGRYGTGTKNISRVGYENSSPAITGLPSTASAELPETAAAPRPNPPGRFVGLDTAALFPAFQNCGRLTGMPRRGLEQGYTQNFQRLKTKEEGTP
jgi:hypothetical protein